MSGPESDGFNNGGWSQGSEPTPVEEDAATAENLLAARKLVQALFGEPPESTSVVNIKLFAAGDSPANPAVSVEDGIDYGQIWHDDEPDVTGPPAGESTPEPQPPDA